MLSFAPSTQPAATETASSPRSPRPRPRSLALPKMLATAVALATLLAACLAPPAPGPASAPAATVPGRLSPGIGAQEVPASVATLASATPTQHITIFFPKLRDDGSLVLAQVRRQPRPAAAPLDSALSEFIRGPNGPERQANLQPPLRPTTRLLGTQVLNGVAIANFDSGLQQVYGEPWNAVVYWALVCTATGSGADRGLTLEENGQRLRYFGTPPYAIQEAASCASSPVEIEQ